MPVELVLSAQNLCFTYQVHEVLTDVSFSVSAGDYIGIVGPNGSGKTTLLNLILGLLRPSKGKISLFASNPADFMEWEKIGYLSQKISTYNPHFPATVKEIVALGLLSQKKMPKYFNKADEEAIDRVLSLLGIEALKDNPIGELSGGQQQRVFLGRALVHGPEFLILDEPTLALDPAVREKFFTTLQELNKNKKVTILLVTHDVGTIGRYASKMLYLDKKAVFYGNFDEFCSSAGAEEYFGQFAQHIICHRHD